MTNCRIAGVRSFGRGIGRAALVVTLGMVTNAGLAQAESLQEALESAYSSNPTLLAERARLRATDEQVGQARAGWLPTITVQGSYGVTETRTVSPFFVGGTREVKPLSGQASISQPIFRGGRSFFTSKQAHALVKAGRANLIGVEQQVLLDAVTAYSDIIRDMAVVGLSKNNVQVLERQLQASNDRFRVGEITRTDVAQSEARLSLARSNLIAAQATLTGSRASYERVIGHVAEANLTLPELPPLPSTEEEAIVMAVARNPQIVASNELEKASRNAARAAKGALLPQIDLTGSLNHNENSSFIGDQTDSTRVAGQVTIPLYQGGAAYSRIRQAKHTNNQNRIEIAETERLVREAAINAWDALVSTRAIIVSSEQQVRANEIAFDGVQQEAQVGSRTTLDVLDAEQELLDSKVALVRARRDEYVAAYSLLATVGNLTAKSLALNVDYYDPRDSFSRMRLQLVGFGTKNE